MNASFVVYGLLRVLRD